MFDHFLDLVDPAIHHRSGSVFYSGRRAFSAPAPLYLLGLNPGGSVERQAAETVARHIADARARQSDGWSEYLDESWNGRPPGRYKMQPRILHLLRRVGLHPHETPASNVVFVRSGREVNLDREKGALLTACWPVHQAVIDHLGVRTVACLGGTAGGWVRDALGAQTLVDTFVEANARRWTSTAHENEAGQVVLTLSHPSIADWTAAATDPTPLVEAALKRSDA